MTTAAGPVTVSRLYLQCVRCGGGGYPADGVLGTDVGVSKGARRMACLAGSVQSFAAASRLLDELAGWTLSDESIRRACYREAAGVADFEARSPAAAAPFGKAKGAVEFQTDAAKVNTTGGWRDMKICVFAKRPEGLPSTPEELERRHLPAPSVRVGFAAIEGIEAFGPKWGEGMKRLGIAAPASVSVLGDGAEWIWNQARESFPGATQVLDFYHASEHLADAAKLLFGEGTEAARQWHSAMRGRLLADGWHGVCEGIGQTLAEENTPARQQALEGLTAYLANHSERINYALRLHQGRSIGSGMIEGAAKNLVGKRMKQTGARWKVENANKMARLCCLEYSELWNAYWLAL